MLGHQGEDEPRTSSPSATRALTHEDSLRLGLILQADTVWAGTVEHGF